LKAPIRAVDGACGPRQRSSNAVAVERDGLRPLVPDQVLDQLDLVVLPLLPEELNRFPRRQLAALEGLVGLDVLGHPLLDPG
jgi:hypothetical protein